VASDANDKLNSDCPCLDHRDARLGRFPNGVPPSFLVRVPETPTHFLAKRSVKPFSIRPSFASDHRHRGLLRTRRERTRAKLCPFSLVLLRSGDSGWLPSIQVGPKSVRAKKTIPGEDLWTSTATSTLFVDSCDRRFALSKSRSVHQGRGSATGILRKQTRDRSHSLLENPVVVKLCKVGSKSFTQLANPGVLQVSLPPYIEGNLCPFFDHKNNGLAMRHGVSNL